jgi:hypothetical protein
VPLTLAVGLVQVAPAHAASTSKPPAVVANTAYPVCAGNFIVGRGLCIPWVL